MTRTNKGAFLKKLRLEKKFTLEEAGKKIGVSKQTLYKYENEIITNIPSDKIEALANLYQVSPAQIMGWKDENIILTPKDERDIQKRLQSILDDLNSNAALNFYNGDQKMDEETKELLKISLENSIRTAKIRAKENFTPKKYRKTKE